MRIELIKKDGQNIGYKLIKEETDELSDVEHVRDMWFWGLDGTVLQYAGRIPDAQDNTVGLQWLMKDHK